MGPNQKTTLSRRLSNAEQRRHQAQLAAQPFDHEVNAAGTALTKATAEKRALELRQSTARRRDRKSIRAEIAVAGARVESASAARLSAVQAAQPTSSEVASASQELIQLRREQQREELFARWSGGTETIRILEQRVDALDTWRQWASGATIDAARLNQIAGALFVTKDPASKLTVLHNTMLAHNATRDLVQQARPEIAHPPAPILSIG